MLKLTKPDGTPIKRWNDWARPKKTYHWKEERSAMELAKAWFSDGQLSSPVELMSLLLSHERLQGLKLIRGIPEHVTVLPEKGEGRNHDLWLSGETSREKVTVCIEAKADEPFGNDTVSEYLKSSIDLRNRGVSTGVPERIDALLKVVGQPISQWGDIRYQLLTAICGTAIQAKRDNSTLGFFIVHEFHTNSTEEKNLKRNDEDFKSFLMIMGVRSEDIAGNRLFGPFMVGGIDCLVGKVITVVK